MKELPIYKEGTEITVVLRLTPTEPHVGTYLNGTMDWLQFAMEGYEWFVDAEEVLLIGANAGEKA